MYRPTVRYDDLFKKYVDQVFRATSLDRNQIIRLALFTAPFSPLFQNQLNKHMTCPLPQATWEVTDHGLWLEQAFNKGGEGSDVSSGESDQAHNRRISSNENRIGMESESKRREREISTTRVLKSGGITIKIG